MQEIGIESSVLENIRNGSKTIEGRLGKPKFLKMKPGDLLRIREDVWENGEIVRSIPNQMAVEIGQILYFETFLEMMESVDFESAVPGAESAEEAVARYRKYYTIEDEEEYGVVAIMFVES